MTRQLTLPELESVRRMLRGRVRHSEIARRLDIAVNTISRIAGDRKLRRQPLGDIELPEDDPPPGYEARNMRRCHGCGGMVYLWPCLTCQLREGFVPSATESDANSPPDVFAANPELRTWNSEPEHLGASDHVAFPRQPDQQATAQTSSAEITAAKRSA